MRKLTCDPNLEVIGAAVLALVDNVQSDEIAPFMNRHGLGDVNPNRWYPAQYYLNVMNDLAKQDNTSMNFVAIGTGIAENLYLPPEFDNATLPDVLEAWDYLYKVQHRGSDDIGYVKTEKLGRTHYKTTHVHLYPDDMVYGLAYGFARRYLPKGTSFKVEYDSSERTMDNGGNRTIVYVKW